MTERGDIPPDLRRVGEQLARSRPRPRSMFVDALGDHLEGGDAMSRRRTAVTIVAYAGSGAALLALAALGAAGSGPLSP